ncbi:hypothetical protein F5884DRAFT_832263 [Xylogone sp. PMI_703]|nr:hypothetical protein F5884DRAFT_832263 [Xylogone sp. PMI_703]
MTLARPFKQNQGWTMERKRFVAVFGARSFTVMTYGALQDECLSTVHAIIETKNADRRHDDRWVCMQEAAQLVGWLLTHADYIERIGRRRQRFMLVSQDREKVYLTFAKLGDHYLDYLRGEDRPENLPSSFSHQVEEGQWDVTRREDMDSLAISWRESVCAPSATEWMTA